MQKVLWLLDLLQVPFEHVLAGMQHEFNKSNAEWLKISPTGLVPVLQFNGVTVDESNTILRMLDEHFGSPFGGGNNPVERAKVGRWLDFVFTVFYAIKPIYFHQIRGVATDAAVLELAERETVAAMSLLEKHLSSGGGREYLALESRLSLAEIALGAQIHRFFTLNIVRPTLPHLEKLYQEKLRRNQGFVRVIENVAFV